MCFGVGAGANVLIHLAVSNKNGFVFSDLLNSLCYQWKRAFEMLS